MNSNYSKGTYRLNSSGERSHIFSLQALRALAFLGIFLNHSGYYISWPALGVSVFFVMSGFLMMKNHGKDDYNPGFKANLIFSIRRISKVYRLHIVTMFLAAMLDLLFIIRNHEHIKRIFILFIKVLLNTALVQSWIPKNSVNTSLNGVAWYLSAALFLYFIFPTLAMFLKKHNIHPYISFFAFFVFVILVQTISCIPFILYNINNDIYIWFMYCFPVFRCGEFIIGMFLYRVYEYQTLSLSSSLNSRARFILYSILEVFGIIITILIFTNIRLPMPSLISQAFYNWTTQFIIPAAIWVYLFASQNGVITKLLSNRVFVSLGNISSYAFLIHYVIILYVNNILQFTNISIQGSINMLVLAELILTIVLSILYKNITTRKI